MKVVLYVKTISGTEFHKACKQTEVEIAKDVMKDTRLFVPAKTGVFSNNTRVDKNEVVYTADYVHYLWRGKVMVNRETGKGPRYIPGVGLRYKKGTKLIETDRNLVFTTDMHSKAQSHWMEASYAQNAQKWAGDAERAVKHFLGE